MGCTLSFPNNSCSTREVVLPAHKEGLVLDPVDLVVVQSSPVPCRRPLAYDVNPQAGDSVD